MGDAAEKPLVDPDESREDLSVDLICLHCAFGDEPDTTRSTHDHVMSEGIDQTRDPG